uniref:Uncharacterized protein n=1 Tax=Opuntia streptacantha TaxID=393608 RepID=A0A7C8ZBF9_OPUST
MFLFTTIITHNLSTIIIATIPKFRLLAQTIFARQASAPILIISPTKFSVFRSLLEPRNIKRIFFTTRLPIPKILPNRKLLQWHININIITITTINRTTTSHFLCIQNPGTTIKTLRLPIFQGFIRNHG